MAYKKLSEATLVESVAEEATMLIEENDEIKRASVKDTMEKYGFSAGGGDNELYINIGDNFINNPELFNINKVTYNFDWVELREIMKNGKDIKINVIQNIGDETGASICKCPITCYYYLKDIAEDYESIRLSFYCFGVYLSFDYDFNTETLTFGEL